MEARILIVSNDRSTLKLLESEFAGRTEIMFTATKRENAIRSVSSDRPNVVIIDLCLEGITGISLLKEVKNIDPGVSVIVIEGECTAQNAIEAMRNGAFDYFEKPLDLHRLGKVVQKAVECNYLNRKVRYAHQPEHLAFDDYVEDIMIGSSPKMVEIWKLVGMIADKDVPVLITGESGTGKELLARAIYHNSKRSGKPFLAVNCAAIPDTLMESELFGHEKGAFTDSHCRRIGKFEQCDGGTVFLDEIGDMSLANQSKLLRVLENRGFERVGGNKTLYTDVRVIAATNCNLENQVKNLKFRLDLYHRLRVMTFQLPALRERIDDLPLLVELFIKIYAGKYGKAIKGVSPKVQKHLIAHPWEGNIRELKNVVDSAVVLSKGDMLLEEDFEKIFDMEVICGVEASNCVDHYYNFFVQMLEPKFDEIMQKNKGSVYDVIHSGAEKALIYLIMSRCDNNQVEASKALGISRNTLRKRLECFGIDSDKIYNPAPHKIRVATGDP